LPKTSTGHDRSSVPFDWTVPLAEPCFTSEEEHALIDAFRSGWWTAGPVTQQLEQEFAAYVGARHAVAVANGTAALHLAMVALGLGPGQEVLTPALTFVAASNMMVHLGASPRFADVESMDNPVVSADALAQALTPNVRGICVMHYGGYACAMDSITEFARKHGLWLIEDAAHAPGASWRGARCGAWGDIGCFSFFGNKNLTCGEGGMLVTNREDVATTLRSLRSHGMTTVTWDRHLGHSFSYDVPLAGYNYRMDDLRASVLRVQLRALEELNELRRERIEWYRQLLSGDPRWIIPFEHYVGVSAGHLFVLVLSEGISREVLMRSMQCRGIQTSIHYPPVHQFSFYRSSGAAAARLPVTEALGRRLVTLPLFPGMTREQVKQVTHALFESLDEADSSLR
jgi:dTDP-4-amino-4,6-dideoxygalactose transaminase